MARFIYSAYGVAVCGRITRPINCPIEPRGVCVLPPCGGKVSAKDAAYSLTDNVSGEFLLSYSSAETSIEGTEVSPGVHRTVLISTVRDLKVGAILRADEVISKLTLNYDMRTDKVTISTAGSAFTNLTLAGREFKVAMNHALGEEAADYAAFKEHHHEHKERHGRIWYSLAKHPDLKFDEFDHGYHHHPNFGRIHFAEWNAASNTQELTMLRLKLGSPQEGDVWIGGGKPNGSGYP